MKLFLQGCLLHAPFLTITKNEIVGVVIEGNCKKRNAVDVILEINENHEQLSIRFPKGDCTPYEGDTIEVHYRSYFFPFLKPCNKVLIWSRKHSQIPTVHNTMHTSKSNIWLGMIPH